jgi:tRNA-dihydrouridine synthase B
MAGRGRLSDALGQQMERIPAATAAAEASSELDEPAEMAA